MTLIVFEDSHWRNFAPIVQARPLYELRCGSLTLRERIAAMLAGRPETQLPNHVTGLCRPHLMGHYGVDGGIGTLLGESAPLTFVNARALDIHWLPDLLDEPLNTIYEADGVLVGARVSPALASAVLYYLRDQSTRDALEELRRFANVRELDLSLLNYPWDMIGQNGEQIIRDLPLLAMRLPQYRGDDPSITVRGDGHVYVAPTAELDGPIVLDARDGPVIIDEQAHIEPFSFIQGPAYIGAGTLISSARIRAETSIGPVCRIGGEVEASIIQGFSNKHHEGFLGHSWLGEWVNVGAMTTNSDLKNTYGTVRVMIEGLGQIDTGVLKLGCFLADHVKLGIGLHLNGGTVISTGSSVFGVHFAPKTVPPFTWGGEIFREYRIDSMISVARKVMERRKQEFSPQYEAMLRAVFMTTRMSRASLVVQPTISSMDSADTNEALLLRAEAEAIKSFEAA